MTYHNFNIKQFIVFFLLCNILFVSSCEKKDKWIEVDLKSTDCIYEGPVYDTVLNFPGTVNQYEDSEIYLISGKIEGPPAKSIIVCPCNLPEEYKQDDLEIIFDGLFIDVQDSFDPDAQLDFLASPFKLTFLKIKK